MKIDRLRVIQASGFRHNKRTSPAVNTVETYHVSDYWDGGSRDACRAVSLPSLRPCALPNYEQQTAGTAGNPFKQSMGTCTLTDGVAIVEQSTFRGKDIGCQIYVTHHDAIMYFGCEHEDCANHPELAQACKESTSDTTARDLKIIATVRGLKSNYHLDGLRRIQATAEELNKLVDGGYLTRLPSGNYQATDKGKEITDLAIDEKEYPL